MLLGAKKYFQDQVVLGRSAQTRSLKMLGQNIFLRCKFILFLRHMGVLYHFDFITRSERLANEIRWRIFSILECSTPRFSASSSDRMASSRYVSNSDSEADPLSASICRANVSSSPRAKVPVSASTVSWWLKFAAVPASNGGRIFRASFRSTPAAIMNEIATSKSAVTCPEAVTAAA